MNHPTLQYPAPWNNPSELAVPVSINGTVVNAVPFLNAVTGDVIMGSAGFEADDPYLLVATSDIAALGDLHDKPVIIGTDNYIIRNVRAKNMLDMTRLILQKR